MTTIFYTTKDRLRERGFFLENFHSWEFFFATPDAQLREITEAAKREGMSIEEYQQKHRLPVLRLFYGEEGKRDITGQPALDLHLLLSSNAYNLTPKIILEELEEQK